MNLLILVIVMLFGFSLGFIDGHDDFRDQLIERCRKQYNVYECKISATPSNPPSERGAGSSSSLGTNSQAIPEAKQ